jgi:hypothetical protein
MAVWPFAQKPGVDTATRGRLALSSLWTPARDVPLKVTSGLINDGGGVVSVVAGTMNVQVTACRGIIQGTVSAAQGGYPVVIDATETIALPNGGGADTPYTIALLLEDSAFDLSGQQRARVVAYATAGGPPVNSGVIPLRSINLRAGVSAGSGGLLATDLGTDLRVYTVAIGGVLPTLSTGRPGQPFTGQWIYETDTGLLRVWTGAVWKAIRKDVFITVNTFFSNGTWNKPADIKTFRHLVWGAGGGGGPVDGNTGQGEGGGGGGGGYAELVGDASALAASLGVTVGVGGAAGLGSPGPTGGSSSIGSASATGGTGGVIMQANTTSQLVFGGTGGVGSGGNYNFRGGDGGRGRTINGIALFANYGGNGAMGGGIRTTQFSSASGGSTGNFPGGGGTGGFSATTDQNGGAGANGYVVAENYF